MLIVAWSAKDGRHPQQNNLQNAANGDTGLPVNMFDLKGRYSSKIHSVYKVTCRIRSYGRSP
jgi:hypothetical protein